MESSSSFPQFSSFDSSKEKKRDRRSTDKGKVHKERRTSSHSKHNKRERTDHQHDNRDKYIKPSSYDSQADSFLQNISKSLYPIPSIPNLFEYDLIGDENNSKYGKPYKHSIPKYHRFTSSVLGLSDEWKIIYSKSDFNNSEVNIRRIKKRDSILWNGGRSYIDKNPVKFFYENSSSNNQTDRSIDKRIHVDNDNTSNNPMDTLFNDDLYSIDQKRDIESFTYAYLQNLLHVRGEVYKSIEREPNNTDLWFRVLEYEEIILRYSKSTKKNSNEVIESILSRALKANPGNHRLIIKYMSIQQTTLDPSKKWKEYVVDYPKVIEYWLSWVECLLQRHNGTVLEAINYIEKQNLFDLLASKYHYDQLSLEEMEEIFMRILHRLCQFLVEAGYIELAIGIYQALIEVNFFSPLEKEKDLEIVLKSFKLYWNMETAHIGDRGAVGWMNTTSDSVVLKGNEYPFPARSIDLPDNEEDYKQFTSRVVLYRDIKVFIRVINSRKAKTDILWGIMDILSAPKLTWKYCSDSTILERIGESSTIGESERGIRNLFCARIISQLIKQLSAQSTLSSIENEFYQWCLEFMYDFDKTHFNRISKMLFSSNDNLLLWAKYASIMFDKEIELSRSIFEKSLNDMIAIDLIDDWLYCWYSWVVNELKVNGDLTRVNDLLSTTWLKYHHEHFQLSLSQMKFTQSVGISRILIAYINCNNYLIQGEVLTNELKQFWDSIKLANIIIHPFTNDAILTCLNHYKRNNPVARLNIIYEFVKTSILQRSEESFPDVKLFTTLAEYGNDIDIIISSFSYKSRVDQVLWLVYGLTKMKGMINSLRSLYQQTLNPPSQARNSSFIWNMYLNFELNNNIYKAREILLTSLKECGWSSTLYSASLKEPIKSLLGPLTLNEINNIINERSIRVNE